MHLLAFDTATEACSVALSVDGAIRERFEVAPRRHAELALPWAEALLAEAGVARSALDAIAVSRGPGAFTGVRLGISIAQGLALALDRPVVPVSTLAVLAMRAGPVDPAESTPVLAAIDARMGEVYLGTFLRAGDDVRALAPERVVAPGRVEPGDLDAVAPHGEGSRWLAAGTGLAADDQRLLRTLSPRLASADAAALPRAADLARLAVAAFARGEMVAPEFAEPAYLRDHVALTVAEQQAARAAR